MEQRSRRWVLSTAAATLASLATAGRLMANTGQALPEWGQTRGTTDLTVGPLGLNPAPDPGQVPVAMRIPDAGVDAEVEKQVIVDGQMQNPSGPWVVAWYESSARAGERGNCLGAGHVDYWGVGPSVFKNLSGIGEGALIDMVGVNGVTYTYAVEYIRRIDIYDTSVEELNSPELVGTTDYPALTLITCGGNFTGEEYTQRDVVRGRLTKVTNPEGTTEDVQPSATESTPSASSVELANGSTASVIEGGVNLRDDASTDANVIQVLDAGTSVTITGDSKDVGGYTWWPVKLEDGTTGWVAADFLEAAP